jgi:hypothetical protein
MDVSDHGRPGSIRDFLYLDTERIRSLLAQLEGGVVERVADRMTRSAEARAGGSVFKLFDLGGTLLREKSSEQTKSLQDALFLLFEEAATEAGVLHFPTNEISDVDAWQSGRVHETLRPSELIQLTAPIRILDSTHFRARTERLSRWPRLITTFANQETLGAVKNAKEKERKLEHLIETQMGPGVSATFKDVGEFVELFMAGLISVRQLACGIDHAPFSFVGVLLDRAGYLQEEREALFSKYGSMPNEWTMVFQIASIPNPNTVAPTEVEAVDVTDAESGQISREGFEKLCLSLMQVIESIGVAEAPTFPSISVTPLAIFRDLPVTSAGIPFQSGESAPPKGGRRLFAKRRWNR